MKRQKQISVIFWNFLYWLYEIWKGSLPSLGEPGVHQMCKIWFSMKPVAQKGDRTELSAMPFLPAAQKSMTVMPKPGDLQVVSEKHGQVSSDCFQISNPVGSKKHLENQPWNHETIGWREPEVTLSHLLLKAELLPTLYQADPLSALSVPAPVLINGDYPLKAERKGWNCYLTCKNLLSCRCSQY